MICLHASRSCVTPTASNHHAHDDYSTSPGGDLYEHRPALGQDCPRAVQVRVAHCRKLAMPARMSSSSAFTASRRPGSIVMASLVSIVSSVSNMTAIREQPRSRLLGRDGIIRWP
jgi:hypothetical protein